jgi:hypothetical protein
MALYLERKDTYLWPVTVTEAQDGGKFRKYTFEAEFKRVSQTRREELGRQLLIQKTRIEAGRIEERNEKGKMVPIEILTPREIAEEVWVGWAKVKDREGEGGEDVPFSEAIKAQLLDREHVADAILEAWNESNPGAKVKN